MNNNSYILITDITEGNRGALLCSTDNTECCRDIDTPTAVNRGQWLYPNGSLIGTNSIGQGFYVSRGPGVVHLNRRNNAISTSRSGLFCCEVPDATSANTRVCVNVIGKSV